MADEILVIAVTYAARYDLHDDRIEVPVSAQGKNNALQRANRENHRGLCRSKKTSQRG
ncbi:MAG: hypothetical protein AB9903_03660 [Vulcanimicrobiota bacterium]